MSIVAIGLIIDVEMLVVSLVVLRCILGLQEDKAFFWHWGIAIALCITTLKVCVPTEKDVAKGKAVYVSETHTVDGDTIRSEQYIMWKHDLNRR